jgi:hypothetical protein
MKLINGIICFLLIVLFIYGCNGCGDNISIEPKYKNVKILLDLSDRITTSDQIQRDKILLDSIFVGYNHLVRTKFVECDNEDEELEIDHSFNVNIFQQQTNSALKDDIENNLQISSIKESKNADKFMLTAVKQKDLYIKTIEQLYTVFNLGNDRNKYTGADIYKYFNEELQSNDIDSNKENLFVIFSDGYMFVKGKQGEDYPQLDLTVLNKFKDKNIKVLLIEMDPKSIDGEITRLRNGWIKWFNNMGIEADVVEKRDLNTTCQKLTKFLGYTVIAPISNISIQNTNPNNLGTPVREIPLPKQNTVTQIETPKLANPNISNEVKPFIIKHSEITAKIKKIPLPNSSSSASSQKSVANKNYPMAENNKKKTNLKTKPFTPNQKQLQPDGFIESKAN